MAKRNRKKSETLFRDRVKELRRVRAGDLQENSANWRRHPQEQVNALAGVISEIGFAGALVAYEGDDGALTLIDGHMRAGVDAEQELPVIVLDVNEAEAKKLLATYDPIGAMAQTDTVALTSLLDAATFKDAPINDMLKALADAEPISLNSSPEDKASAYTRMVKTPIYEPKGEQPRVDELSDRSTANELIDEIKQTDLPEDIQKFLMDAAERHVGFDYSRIANYYAHAPSDVRALMERSALIIIDYNQAIEHGFVRFTGEIDTAFHDDYPDA